MKAIHVNWTSPFFHKERLRGHGFKVFRDIQDEIEYIQPIYQILTTVLSTLWWKKLNGSIKLYTDYVGRDYYEKIGILDIYDEVDVETLESYKGIDPAHFWTSGKIHCLLQEKEPFVFIDQDFIVRSKLDDLEFNKYDLTIPHWEIPRGYYYFTEDQFKKEITHCEYPTNYNTNSLVPNTSFLWFNNLNLIKEYLNFHDNLVCGEGIEVPEWFWLLTDQGILGHTIREGNYNVSSISSNVFLSDSDHTGKDKRHLGMAEPWFKFIDGNIDDKCSWEHLWYMKAVFSDNEELKNQYIKRYLEEIVEFFPKYKNIKC